MSIAEEYLTSLEIANSLRVSRQTVRRWLKSGALPAFRPAGPRTGWRIAKRDFLAFIAGHKAAQKGRAARAAAGRDPEGRVWGDADAAAS